MKQSSLAKFFVTAGIVTGGLMTALPTMAMSDACSLQAMGVPADVKMSSSEIKAYQTKLSRECDLSKSFWNARAELHNMYQVELTDMTEYQAMRFIRRPDFNASKAQNIPIEKTYQIHNSEYALPNAQKSSVIWDNWAAGIQQLEGSRAKVLSGGQFTLEDLKRTHIGFFTLSNEIGDAAHEPDMGLFKNPTANDGYWWEFKNSDEAASAKIITDQVNAHYKAMGLLEPASADYEGILRVGKARKINKKSNGEYVSASDEMVDVIYSGDSRVNQQNTKRILNFVNTMLKQGMADQLLVWNGKLVTPLEVATLAQKYYVGVHPFSEGNGRTSRFIQELIMTSFAMPHGSSGDLMDDDVLTTFETYYERSLTSNLKLMDTIAGCARQYKDQRLVNAAKIKANATAVDYSCRLLN